MPKCMLEHRGYLIKVGLLFLLIFIAKSCETVKEAIGSATHEKNIVLLVSIDGFRYDYRDKAHTPVMDSLAKTGVSATALVPVFPSKTFPNHFTQVTGLYPENHGVISNRMYDPEFREYFTIGSGSSTTSDGKWYQAEPIWVTAKNQGLTTATMFWPGSDAEINGARPDYYFQYNGSVSKEHRVSQVIEWLSLQRSRPRFITLYFEQIDGIGHLFGPNAEAVDHAVEGIDKLLGHLIQAIAGLGLINNLDLIILSDHGMIELSRDKAIFLDDYIDLGVVDVINWSPIAEIIPAPGQHQEIYDNLIGAHENLQVYTKDNILEKWHFNNHRRITPIVAVADPGWSVTSSDYFYNNTQAYTGGSHGFDPQDPSMHGFFIASGPSFQSGVELDAIESVHIYELLCTLLDIVPLANDGKLEVWYEAIK